MQYPKMCLLLSVLTAGLSTQFLHARSLPGQLPTAIEIMEPVTKFPAACDTPSAQPRYIGMGTVKADSATGYLEPVADADGYLVIVSTSNQPGFTPATGTAYTVGSNVGNSKVVKAGAGNTFTATGLQAGTSYYVYAFSMKTTCPGGPLYRSYSPVAVVVRTPSSPAVY